MDEVLLPTCLLTLKSYWPLYDEQEEKCSSTQPHLSPLGWLLSRGGMCDQVISKEGQGLVLLSFSADKLLAESGTRCVLFISSANARVLRPQKSDLL